MGREEVERWLDASVSPSSPHALVHRDFKLDNVMSGPEAPPEIAGIVDWELSTLGDPRFDLAWLGAY